MSTPASAAGPSDEELVRRYLEGGARGAAAFDALVDRYADRVYAICLRYFRNPSDAEDAAQETFVTLLRRASSYRGGAAFSTWLHRVTMNTCHDLNRRRRRGRGGLSRQDDPGNVPEPFHSEDQADRVERILSPALVAALDALDADTRDAVMLHDVAGLPYAQIGERLGLPVGTVKSRIHRAHSRMAAVLREKSRNEVTP